MNVDEFEKFYRTQKVKRPKVFELAITDALATEIGLAAIERTIRLKLPKDYKSFLMKYGGGMFGLVNVLSADPNSDYYVLSVYNSIKERAGINILPFSDDFAGGWYGFKIKNGKVLDEIFYWNVDTGLVSTRYKSFLDFVSKNAY